MVNCVVSFELVGCSDAPKGDILTALYYIDVRLIGTTPQSNAINPDRFYRLFSSLFNLLFNFVNAVITSGLVHIAVKKINPPLGIFLRDLATVII